MTCLVSWLVGFFFFFLAFFPLSCSLPHLFSIPLSPFPLPFSPLLYFLSKVPTEVLNHFVYLFAIYLLHMHRKSVRKKKPNLIMPKAVAGSPQRTARHRPVDSGSLCPNILAAALDKTLWMVELLNSRPGLVILCAHCRVCIIHCLWLSDSMHKASSVLAVHERLSYVGFFLHKQE